MQLLLLFLFCISLNVNFYNYILYIDIYYLNCSKFDEYLRIALLIRTLQQNFHLIFMHLLIDLNLTLNSKFAQINLGLTWRYY